MFSKTKLTTKFQHDPITENGLIWRSVSKSKRVKKINNKAMSRSQSHCVIACVLGHSACESSHGGILEQYFDIGLESKFRKLDSASYMIKPLPLDAK